MYRQTWLPAHALRWEEWIERMEMELIEALAFEEAAEQFAEWLDERDAELADEFERGGDVSTFKPLAVEWTHIGGRLGGVRLFTDYADKQYRAYREGWNR